MSVCTRSTIITQSVSRLRSAYSFSVMKAPRSVPAQDWVRVRVRGKDWVRVRNRVRVRVGARVRA